MKLANVIEVKKDIESIKNDMLILGKNHKI